MSGGLPPAVPLAAGAGLGVGGGLAALAARLLHTAVLCAPVGPLEAPSCACEEEDLDWSFTPSRWWFAAGLAAGILLGPTIDGLYIIRRAWSLLILRLETAVGAQTGALPAVALYRGRG